MKKEIYLSIYTFFMFHRIYLEINRCQYIRECTTVLVEEEIDACVPHRLIMMSETIGDWCHALHQPLVSGALLFIRRNTLLRRHVCLGVIGSAFAVDGVVYEWRGRDVV